MTANKLLNKERVYLPDSLSNSDSLEENFKALLGSKEAASAKGIVYFYEASEELPCKIGNSTILYIGKTKSSLKKRYYQYAKKLARNANGTYYKNIIKNYGPVKLSYFLSENPRADEAQCFREFRQMHQQNPDKSKRG